MCTPSRPPMVNRATNPIANNKGVLKLSFPPHIVASQEKILTPVGTPMMKLLAEKKSSAPMAMPVANI